MTGMENEKNLTNLLKIVSSFRLYKVSYLTIYKIQNAINDFSTSLQSTKMFIGESKSHSKKSESDHRISIGFLFRVSNDSINLTCFSWSIKT